MIRSLKNRLLAGRWIATYHLRVLRKQLKNAFTDSPPLFSEDAPSVTIFITSLNNRYPLELTLRTLVEHTSYPNYEIWVGDNGSTDGSVELIESLINEGWPLRLIEQPEGRPQHEWYDLMAENVQTKYWVGVHEDMMFTGDGWLEDLIHFMETHPDTLLLGGERRYSGVGAEPVSGEIVEDKENLSTWIFCARENLRNFIGTSFEFHKEWDKEDERYKTYDLGARLIEDMRLKGLNFECMPESYLDKFHHLGSITWSFQDDRVDMSKARRTFKEHQIKDAKRRVQRTPASNIKVEQN